jgi:hypothetical protein
MSVALTERQERDIEALCRIAKENGAVVTLRELIGLAAIDASELELEGAFNPDQKLGSKFQLESGYLLERPAETGETPRQTVEEELRRRERAAANLRIASVFGGALRGGTLLVSVSGGNSFLSAREDEDIDFFCVTTTNGMWSFVLRAIVMARIHRLANRDAPVLCFSCIMDERWAREAFGKRQDAIFARDALTAKLISGGTAYRALLEEASWMEDYFPAFYRMRVRDAAPYRRPHQAAGEGQEGSEVLNSFLHLTLGSFLKMKSWALNRKFTKAGRSSSIFTTRIGSGHYIYESNRYRKLRTMYGDLSKKA